MAIPNMREPFIGGSLQLCVMEVEIAEHPGNGRLYDTLWQTLWKPCMKNVQVHTTKTKHSSNRFIYHNTTILYSSNGDVGVFMEKREIEGPCLHHPQFSFSLESFYI